MLAVGGGVYRRFLYCHRRGQRSPLPSRPQAETLACGGVQQRQRLHVVCQRAKLVHRSARGSDYNAHHPVECTFSGQLSESSMHFSVMCISHGHGMHHGKKSHQGQVGINTPQLMTLYARTKHPGEESSLRRDPDQRFQHRCRSLAMLPL